MNLIASPKIIEKLLDKHGLVLAEVEEAFLNRTGHFLIDSRQEHRTIPPTMWFIAPTNRGRLLKVVFVRVDEKIYLKTAYEPNATERRIYFER